MASTSYVKISPDELMAYIYMEVPKDGEIYTRDDVIDLLKKNGVVYGIMEDVVDGIVKRGAYGREIAVAKGIAPVEGADGFYEFFFDTKPTDKPRIREDGTVDYRTISAVQCIMEGQVLAKYTPAVMGTPGRSVKGRELTGKRAKDLMPLKGKGFTRSEDGLTYTASIDGKAEYTSNDNRLVVSNILEIREDINFINGKLDFRGDIVIHGSVESGCEITATGSITIDGNIEASNITAGKDIILRNGMQGGGRGTVRTKGSIYAKFMEGCNVYADGNIVADEFMNSKVNAGGHIEMAGKLGLILGGSVHAIRGIHAENIGNAAEIKSTIKVGVDQNVFEKINLLKKEIKEINEALDMISEELAEFEKVKGNAPKFQLQNIQMRTTGHLRNKIKFNAQLAEKGAELKKLLTVVEDAKNATITVSKYLYPGTTIKVNSVSKVIESKCLSVSFSSEKGELVTNDVFVSV